MNGDKPLQPPSPFDPSYYDPENVRRRGLLELLGGIQHYFTEPNVDGGQLRVGRPEEFRQRAAEVLFNPIFPPPPEPPPEMAPALTPRMFGPTKSADTIYDMIRGMSSPLNIG